MTDLTAPPVTIIQPTRGLASLQLRAVWQYRELLGFLAWRDVKVRYKQTALGVAWTKEDGKRKIKVSWCSR